jgi:hypothetical protein
VRHCRKFQAIENNKKRLKGIGACSLRGGDGELGNSET